MDIVIKKLLEIRKKPGMYLGELSLRLLRPYIEGYIACLYEQNKEFDTIFFYFIKHIQHKYNIYSNHGWNSIISFYSSNEEDALNNFYYCLDEFIEEYKTQDEINMLKIVDSMRYEHNIRSEYNEMHYTNHGNIKYIENPHMHTIKLDDNDNLYFDSLFCEVKKTEIILIPKGNLKMFESKQEFVNYIGRGGELEFIYEKNKYSITHPQNKLCFLQIGIKYSEVFFDEIKELLEYRVNSEKIGDICTKILPYFRRF